MPFVSVATSSEGGPEGVAFWVGGREAGTASVLRELVREVSGSDAEQTEERPAGEVLAAAMRNLRVEARNHEWFVNNVP